MQFFEKTLSDPESNLAMDEALLEAAETGSLDETLRFWESPVYFVVLGYSSKWRQEVHSGACQQDQIPILRRKSGGATVLQGPGCLNFSLILKTSESSGIRSDTQRIMRKNLAAAKKWKVSGNFKIQGISDLTWNERKFSGNAMRRGKKHSLFHGTFLYQFNLSKIAHYLGAPEREPAYRAKRNHLDFLTNVPAARETIVASLCQIWNAQKSLETIPDVQKLKKEFYSQAEWNLKY